MGDEAAGAARAEFAEKARKRREAEQAKIAAENAAYKARCRGDTREMWGRFGGDMAQNAV